MNPNFFASVFQEEQGFRAKGFEISTFLVWNEKCEVGGVGCFGHVVGRITEAYHCLGLDQIF
jgi:hypothetical protein